MSGRTTRGAARQGAAVTSSANPATRPARKAAATKVTSESVRKSKGRAPRPKGQQQRNYQDAGDQGEASIASGQPAEAIIVEQPASTVSPGGPSGKTARTSMNSNRGQSVSSPGVLIINLAELDDAAVHMLDHLTPAKGTQPALEKIAGHFHDHHSYVGGRLRDSRDRFQEVRRIYSDEPYINVERAVLKTLGQSNRGDLKPGPWRPDDIFFRANLAIAAEDIQLRHDSTSNYDLNLEKMERDFPEPFIKSVARSMNEESAFGTTLLIRETFQMALDIRVQFAVQTLINNRNQETHDPVSIVQPIFYEEADVRGWDVDGLHTKNLSQPQKKAINTAFNQLRSAATDGQQELERLYPTEGFVGKYLTWIRERSAEINKYLETVEKVMGIQDAAEELLKSQQDDGAVVRGSSSKRVPQDSLQGTTELSAGRKAALQDQLKQFTPAGKGKLWKNILQPGRAAIATSPRTTPNKSSNLRQSSAASPSQARSSQRHQTGTGASSLSPSQARSMVSRFHRDINEGDKENARPSDQQPSKIRQQGRNFIDAQSSAERIPFETQINDSNASLHGEQDDEALGDPSQDIDFEQDGRTASNKRSAPTSHELSGAKRVRIIPAAQADPTSSDARNLGPSTRADDYIEANQAAKARTLVHSSQRPAQRRKPWSYDETTYLHEAIADVGTSWSRIKQADTSNRLEDRDQVALKDKARNLLFDYLKAGQTLPPNFDKIALNASQKNQLRNLGIPLPENYGRPE